MYTTHGHHIPGTVKEADRPNKVARCGGVNLCKQCGIETINSLNKKIAAPFNTDVHPIMRYFTYEHLPTRLQVVSKPFADLAYALDSTLPKGPEASVALRKLLESKDAAVRAALDIPEGESNG